jgi:DNA ligase-1
VNELSILKILNELAADNSRLAKEAILQRELKNDLLREVFVACYDPTINYWQAKIPEYKKSKKVVLLSAALKDLSLMVDRSVTGNEAIGYFSTMLGSLNDDDAEVIKRIVDRDMKCGVTATTVNKIWKKSIRDFTYMRCALPKAVKLKDWNWANGIYSQEKADGMFANLDAYDDTVIITSRNGTVLPNDKLANIVVIAKKHFTVGTRTHGEFLVEENGVVLPREIGNGIMNSIAKGGDFKNKNQKAVYVVWDQIPLSNALSGEDYKRSYSSRFSSLQAQLIDATSDISIIPTKIVKSFEEALEHYQSVLEQGKEGTIIKTQSGIWKDSTSKDQVKFKLEAVVDLLIVGLNPGKGKNEDTFGSVLCRSSDSLLEVNVSGFTDDARLEIFADWDNIKGKIMAVCGNSLMKPSGNKTTWSIFLPRHVEIRDDKTEADSLQQIQDQFDSLIKGV